MAKSKLKDCHYLKKSALELTGSVCVLGKGVTGNAVYNYLKKRTVTISDLDFLDGDELTCKKHYDLTIISPGISQLSDIYKTAIACSDEVISEIEFAFLESEACSKWIAITGTNGKTTTTALTNHILQSCGFSSVAVGNIGDAAISKVDGEPKIYVLECSSYQLASISQFAPDASTILNITPDHLTWHNGFGNYFTAKLNIFKNFDEEKYAILTREAVKTIQNQGLSRFLGKPNQGLSLISKNLDQGLSPFSEKPFIEFGRKHPNIDYYQQILNIADEMQIKGSHNIENAYIALALCVNMGVNLDDALQAIKTFKPLEHRIEPCGEVNGIKFYNDSKATNVDSTIKALSAFASNPRNVHLLLGGKDKLSDLNPLIEAVKNSGVKSVYIYGEARSRFLEEFRTVTNFESLHQRTVTNFEKPQERTVTNFGDSQDFTITEARNLKEAFMKSYKCATPGDVILLSPACASFDEFNSFEHRGEVFKELVGSLKKDCHEF